MKSIKWKLFRNKEKIEAVSFDDSINYYSFLEQQYHAGNRQIIISSSLIVEMLKEFSTKYSLQVYRIELTEDDDSLYKEINEIINSIELNAAYVCVLADRLDFLSSESSIDINRISFKGKTNENHPIDLRIQSNGIIIVNEEAESYSKSIVIPIVEQGVFGWKNS